MIILRSFFGYIFKIVTSLFYKLELNYARPRAECRARFATFKFNERTERFVKEMAVCVRVRGDL